MFNFRLLFRYLWARPKYMNATLLVFAAGIVMGYAYSDRFDAFLQSQLEGLRELARMIDDKPNSTLYMFGIVFLNNVLKSIAIVFSGGLLAFIPIFFLVINGMIIGYLAEMQVNADQLWFFLKAILPHGILEIPAILLASAFGIRFGAIVFKGILTMLSARGRAAFVEELRQFMKMMPALVVLLIVSLLVAALIESTVTPWLMKL